MQCMDIIFQDSKDFKRFETNEEVKFQRLKRIFNIEFVSMRKQNIKLTSLKSKEFEDLSSPKQKSDIPKNVLRIQKHRGMKSMEEMPRDSEIFKRNQYLEVTTSD